MSILCPDARAISLKHNSGHSTPQLKNLQWRPLPTTSKNALSSFQEFASPIKVLTPQELAQVLPGCRSLKLSLVVFSHTCVWNSPQSALSCNSLGSCASHLHPRLQDPVGQVLQPSSLHLQGPAQGRAQSRQLGISASSCGKDPMGQKPTTASLTCALSRPKAPRRAVNDQPGLSLGEFAGEPPGPPVIILSFGWN